MSRPALLALAFSLLAAPAMAGPLDGWFHLPGAAGNGNAVQAQSDGTVADLVARIQRLEGQNRILTGQVQELQNSMRRTLDDFQKYRDDTEYRLQTLEGGGKAPAMPKRSQNAAPGGSSTAAVAPAQGAGPGAAASSLGTMPSGGGQDAMGQQGQGVSQDPMLDDGSSQVAGQQPGDDGFDASRDPNAPMQWPGYGNPPGATTGNQRPMTGLAPPGLPGIGVDQGGAAPPPAAGTQQAALPQSTEDEYTADYRLIEGRSYEAAELAFRKFLQSYPNDKRVPDATHWVGESLFQRQQYRDAAEQFLVVTQKYGSSRRAPSSMLRLGMSLAALGEKEAACATFQEVGRKYPGANASVKSGIDRETKKNGC